MTTGNWIKDKQKRLKARQRRDSCRNYGIHSGSCLIYKIMVCHKCLGYVNKNNTEKDNK